MTKIKRRFMHFRVTHFMPGRILEMMDRDRIFSRLFNEEGLLKYLGVETPREVYEYQVHDSIHQEEVWDPLLQIVYTDIDRWGVYFHQNRYRITQADIGCSQR